MGPPQRSVCAVAHSECELLCERAGSALSDGTDQAAAVGPTETSIPTIE